jgi:hypothetical protein
VAIIRYQLETGMPASSAAAHFAAVAPSLAGLVELTLAWPLNGCNLVVVPDLSPLTRLETLRLHGSPVWDGVDVLEGYEAHQQVVCMLLPVRATLQKLELAVVKGVGPRVALLLQDSFPVLTWIKLADDCDPEVRGALTFDQRKEWEEVLAALRPGVHLSGGLPPYLETPLSDLFS